MFRGPLRRRSRAPLCSGGPDPRYFSERRPGLRARLKCVAPGETISLPARTLAVNEGLLAGELLPALDRRGRFGLERGVGDVEVGRNVQAVRGRLQAVEAARCNELE